jgi:tRNA U34 5-methylaminomethyl-2-thiouridine-forming methyltransferase MnmC
MSDTGTPSYNDLLQTLGVQYPNGPAVTPALLAFLNGLGLNLQTAKQARDAAIQRIGTATNDAMADIDRSAGRTKQNITADLVRRGVLSSGEANTRYARQAEDVAVSRRDVLRSQTSGSTDAETLLQQQKDQARMQALDRLIATEQDQATQQATQQATEEGFQRQQALADQQWQREQQARSDYVTQLQGLYNQAGAQGFAP